MASLSEIEKLEARWAENPDGRYFAPLADAYRKAGRVEDAIMVVMQGLTKHPDYLSAYIVLGRCNLEKKDDDAAVVTFEKVLSLDTENIIALKSLAEIAERQARPEDARRRLTRLLAVDAMNTEAADDLARLGGPIEGETPEAAAEPEEAGVSFADLAPEPDASAADQPPAASEPPPPAAEPRRSAARVVMDPALLKLANQQTLHVPRELPADMPMLGLEPTSQARPSAQAKAPTEKMPALELEPTSLEPPPAPPAPPAAGDLQLIMPEDVTPAAELRRPSMKQVQMVSPEPASGEVGEPLVTETVGDLYLKQGFKDKAIDVYRRLLAARPDDITLRGKLAALESPGPALSAAAQGTEAVGAWLRRIARASLPGSRSAPAAPDAAAEPAAPDAAAAAHSPASVPTPVEPSSAPADQRSPMDQAFAAEPEPEAPPSAQTTPIGEPARPASEPFTLDRVFGGSSARPSGEDERGAGGGSGIAGRPEGAPSSFDEFFGEAKKGQSAPEGPAGQPTEQELSAFNTWLHGLKR